jgi:hypothetical protein
MTMTGNQVRRATQWAALVLPALLIAAGVTPLAQAGQGHRPARYTVVTLASPGGSASAGSSVNNRGWVAGFSNRAGGQTRHATLCGTEGLSTSAPWEDQTARWPGRSRTTGA